jgi:hypothetical protein
VDLAGGQHDKVSRSFVGYDLFSVARSYVRHLAREDDAYIGSFAGRAAVVTNAVARVVRPGVLRAFVCGELNFGSIAFRRRSVRPDLGARGRQNSNAADNGDSCEAGNEQRSKHKNSLQRVLIFLLQRA